MHYLERHGCTVDYVAPDSSGRIKPEQIFDLISEKTILVSLMHVNSETGIIQPIEEVGKEFNVTRERIRQIEAKALRKLRHPSRSRKLKDYLD